MDEISNGPEKVVVPINIFNQTIKPLLNAVLSMHTFGFILKIYPHGNWIYRLRKFRNGHGTKPR